MLLVPDSLLGPSKEGGSSASNSTTFTISELDKLVQFVQQHAERDRLVLIFWSSRNPETGKMWCPDCEEMETNLSNVLKYQDLESITTPSSSSGPDQPSGQTGHHLVYVYVGDRDQWKDPENPFRRSPWNLTKIPTVLKLCPSPPSNTNLNSEIAVNDQHRLVENDANDFKKLLDFLA
ncbi:hypothetical protein PtA15_8A343 [Puccinia triticina]|uniref:Thioredoxin domain-containing protein n=1 Tax=Puccinia triticina TaxID=208348 RepID=A0ABY7CQG3_9BASI|nr:uncharacterized protein PtA15_8A343 [Puccinia triticina]WAQ87439.1 hypothetical protein PtA15_8A343 [Puccinia triticina]WAR57292.1 hypothetical protein PtB15_8B339 [Puccinia triticina]